MLKETEKKIQNSILVLKKDYSNMRATRANPGILDKITVEYYGNMTPIPQIATISVQAKTILIQPWEAKLLSAIEKAIQKSDLGINPNNDGKVLRLVFPPLSEERRKELAKDVSKRKEEAKITIRNIRRDCLDKLKNQKKSSEITDDELKSKENQLQKIICKYEEEIDKISNEKIEEITTI